MLGGPNWKLVKSSGEVIKSMQLKLLSAILISPSGQRSRLYFKLNLSSIYENGLATFLNDLNNIHRDLVSCSLANEPSNFPSAKGSLFLTT